MKIIVQKFGGTSLKNEETRSLAAQHVLTAIKEGYKVVVVVSAIGRKGDPYATDTLLNLITNETGTFVTKREKDLLMSCGELISSVVFCNLLGSLKLKTMAMTGAQAGFRTNEDFSNAKIIEMKCDYLLEKLENHDCVVVTGFQGMSPNGELTTLGRGGSDTSATALGAAVQAEWVDIFTDVEGLMTADPRIVSEAKSIHTVTYNEVCNMAYQGAKVIHPRAVEIAMNAKLPIKIRSTFSDLEGTLVTSDNKRRGGMDVEERLVTGIAYVSNVSQIKVLAKDGDYNLQSQVFKAMANEGISVDFININLMGVVYTVMDENTDKAIELLRGMGYEPIVTRKLAKVSVIGAGMTGVPGVTAKIVGSLAEENISILQSADSHTTIWVLVKEEDKVKAVNALHRIFKLDQN
ncbi:aspartate kinase [Anaerobacillus alkalidiazotrophicus]|uniref:Aspartokinase n=1 Tax=Anaerobacillus alkalidiazotrophicus TaxID=472963 RepID=A0A1S2LZK5_9BACI|nr:aspartate kinase [Anaerobacillus alkalidiazotrophicus]OIJ17889.1 aspartate kinase [Anaerobacillus alkalidiazotrophicus]